MKIHLIVSRFLFSVFVCLLLASCTAKPAELSPAPAKTDAPASTLAPKETAAPTNTHTTAPTLAPTETAAPTGTEASGPSIIGKWERHGEREGRKYTESFLLNPDGTYSIQAKYDDNGEILAEMTGTYTFTADTLTLTDKNGTITTSPYYLTDSGNKLIINNKPEFAWTRAG
jgi:hypothetical protein